MSVRFVPSRKSLYVIPKLDKSVGGPATVDIQDINIPGLMNDANNILNKSSGGYDWKDFTLGIDVSQYKDFVEGVNKFLTFMDNYVTKPLVIVVKLLRLFSSDLKSINRLLSVVLRVLVKKIQQFIESLASFPIAATVIIPDVDKRLHNFMNPLDYGFDELKARVTSACLDPNDPYAPKFGPESKVGGLIIAGMAGQNDPENFSNMLENFEILTSFFGISNPMPARPTNVMAAAGLNKDQSPKITISWNHPGTRGIHGFWVYRCKVYDGVNKTVTVNGTPQNILVYEDKGFEPVYIPALRPKYNWEDKKVKEGTKYFYIVYSVPSKKWFTKKPIYEDIRSPIASARVAATPVKCIPISELQKYMILDQDGNTVDPEDMKTQWISINIRSLLGPSLGFIFDRMNSFTESLIGFTTTSSDAATSFVDFYANKIQGYLSVVTTIQNIVNILLSFRLKGTIMYLNLDFEQGGTEGFVKRFNEATMDPAAVDVKGVYMGIVIVVGFPVINNDTAKLYFPENETAEYKREFKNSMSAWNFFQETLLGGGK